ncbi:hypothetical protein KMZ32_15375 [Phycicoccus sp. MAQZ13P-2]|uniref:hypothetical protein n=1 Tax=Phycicoccus mangrovi TaxID=2840470 RepID=UPI001C006D80|nr:hypothetical protein [Phycicoccus mangrovi]MBT9257053.1 hypothetical protein [Phycicoccus mangrovi]MBT9275457.1 hypothetical protein [Phycicoccus mangrovi]
MAGTSRRGLLAAAGTTTAIAVVATATAAQGATRDKDDVLGELDDAVLVAYIEDPGSGVISLMVGEEEVEVHDPALVRRLVKASGGKA